MGPFKVIDAGTSASGIPIRNVIDNGWVEAATPVLAPQADIIDSFEELFGPDLFDVYGSAVDINDFLV